MNLIRRTPSPLATYRPHSLDEQFGRLVEHMFEYMLSPFAHAAALTPWAEGGLSPRMHISENDQAFEVQADLPGVNKDDVKVAIEHQRVTIEAETKREQEQRQGENVLFSERGANKYMRSFVLPVEVDEGSAQARMENGVLTLTLPKKQGGAVTRIAIQ